MNSEKHERFQRIAETRTNKVINDIRVLSNCADTHNYAYSKEEALQIIRAVDEAVKDLKAAFSEKSVSKQPFSFKKVK